jgi:hypothetical protein
LTKLAYEKISPRRGLSVGDGSTGQPGWWESLRQSGTTKCTSCTEGFKTTGEEMRARPIHLCPRCRLDAVEEAERHCVDASSLSDDALIATMQVVGKFQKRRARTEAELSQAEAEGKPDTADVKRRRLKRLEVRLAAALERVAA